MLANVHGGELTHDQVYEEMQRQGAKRLTRDEAASLEQQLMGMGVMQEEDNDDNGGQGEG